jgi:hypothetical protein
MEENYLDLIPTWILTRWPPNGSIRVALLLS